MKKQFAFILIFFLAFSLQFKSSWSLSTAQCRYYIDGVCQPEGEYTTNYTEETSPNPPETIINSVSSSVSEFSMKFITLAFQLFGIVILVILLIVVVEELVKSGG